MYIVEQIRAAQRRVNYENWSAAQNAYLLTLTNQDPEKPALDISPIQFLPFPDAMQEMENTLRGKVSHALIAELRRAYDNDWFGVRLATTLYSLFLH